MFEEQVGWAVEAGVDFVIGETFSWLGEALARDRGHQGGGAARRHHARPSHRHGTRARDLAGRGVQAARGRRRRRRRAELRPRAGDDAAAARGDPRGRVSVHVAALPVPYRTTREPADLPVARGSRGTGPGDRGEAVPDRARPVHLQPLRDRASSRAERRDSASLPRRLLRRGAAPHPRDGRGARTHAAGQPLLGRHVQALRSGPTPPCKPRTRSTPRGSDGELTAAERGSAGRSDWRSPRSTALWATWRRTPAASRQTLAARDRADPPTSSCSPSSR